MASPSAPISPSIAPGGFVPSLETRFQIAPGSLAYDGQNTYGGGIRIDRPIKRFVPYIDFLVSYGHLSFTNPTTAYKHDNSVVYAGGGGLEYNLSTQWAARADYLFEHWDVGTTSNVSAVPSLPRSSPSDSPTASPSAPTSPTSALAKPNPPVLRSIGRPILLTEASPARPVPTSDAPAASSRFVRACLRLPVDRTPVWFLRQAGRYMPEYMAVRKHHSLLEICRTPEIAAEVTITAAERLGVDAAIIFADLLLPLTPMGLDFEFVANEGPAVHTPIRTPEQIQALRTDRTEDLLYVSRAIEKVAAHFAAPRARRRPTRHHRLLRRALHPRQLHDRRRQLPQLHRNQKNDVRATPTPGPS